MQEGEGAGVVVVAEIDESGGDAESGEDGGGAAEADEDEHQRGGDAMGGNQNEGDERGRPGVR